MESIFWFFEFPEPLKYADQRAKEVVNPFFERLITTIWDPENLSNDWKKHLPEYNLQSIDLAARFCKLEKLLPDDGVLPKDGYWKLFTPACLARLEELACGGDKSPRALKRAVSCGSRAALVLVSARQALSIKS
jgi:hypothetical protein